MDTTHLKRLSLGVAKSIAMDVLEPDETTQLKTVSTEIEEFIDRNSDAFTEASIEFALELIANAIDGKYNHQHFLKSLESLNADELATLAELDADLAEGKSNDILARRRALADDLSNTLGTVARSALSAGVAALTGLAK